MRTQDTAEASSRPASLTAHWLFTAINLLIYARHPYLTWRFMKKVGYRPDVAFPRRYHEKVYWRKVFDRNPAFVDFCDKLKTKAWFRKIIPSLAVVEPLWTGTRLDDAALALIARGDVVLKGNHGSGFNLFPDQLARGLPFVKKTTRRWMSRNFARRYYQPAYRNAARVLLIEPLVASIGAPVFDYYVRASMGKVLVVSVLTNAKRDGQKYGYFDECARRLPHLEPCGSKNTLPPGFVPPGSFSEAMEHSRRASRDFDYLRIDFMSDGERLYAGEVTIYPNAGMTWADENPATDINALTNEGWDLRNSHFFKTRQPAYIEFYRRRLAAALGLEQGPAPRQE